MSHGRKPRRPRWFGNPLAVAMNGASKMHPADVEATMHPMRECAKRLREGVATHDQLTVLRTQVLVALAIEDSGIIKGLRGHFQLAEQHLSQIEDRALASGAWRPTGLYFYELDSINEAVRLHEFQLQQLSAGEVHRIAAKFIRKNQSARVPTQRRTLEGLGLIAAS